MGHPLYSMKMAGRALEVYAFADRANGRELPAHLSMSTVNARPAVGLEKKSGTLTLTGRDGIIDRYFYFAMSLLVAVVVVAGFQRTVDANLLHPAVPRPFILWLHAAAFAAWVVFFIGQSTLVRINKVSWHRFMGWFGAGLAAAMVVLGIATSIILTRFHTVQLHESGGEAFLSITFYDMLAFGVCIALAIYWRTKCDLHRRLVFIATCSLLDAGFGRFDYIFNNNLFYLFLDLVIVLGVVRDLLVERRVHKVYLYALPLLIVGQNLSIYMWRHNPSWWQGITRVIMG